MGNADGSGSPTTILSGLSTPRGVGVDSANSKVYYTEHGTSTLSRVNINGTGNEVVVSASGAGSRGLSLDLVNTEVYWVSFIADTISKADYSLALPTTGTAVLSSRDTPNDVVLDVAGGKMYWGEAGSTQSIFRSNLDGNSVESLVTSANPNFLAIDTLANKVYWTNSSANTVMRANLDGSNSETVYSVGLTVEGIAVDPHNQYIYYTESTNGTINRTGYNPTPGSAITLFSGLSAPHEITLIPEPSTYALLFGGITLAAVLARRHMLRKKKWQPLSRSKEKLVMTPKTLLAPIFALLFLVVNISYADAPMVFQVKSTPVIDTEKVPYNAVGLLVGKRTFASAFVIENQRLILTTAPLSQDQTLSEYHWHSEWNQGPSEEDNATKPLRRVWIFTEQRGYAAHWHKRTTKMRPGFALLEFYEDLVPQRSQCNAVHNALRAHGIRRKQKAICWLPSENLEIPGLTKRNASISPHARYGLR